MPYTINYSKAVNDFHEARRKAELQNLINRLRGESNELLSYEAVRMAMKAVEGNQKKLREIPLDAIVGSVGKYSDFTRDFLPRRDTDQDRWASVMEKAISMEGLPPIEVYQIGDAYFVQDGNHRVSVAKQLDASHIQAYVTEVRTRITLPPDLTPDELIIVAEKHNFFEHTKLDQLRPEANLEVTIPGQYPILEEHISVHQYFMGIDEGREIKFEEAVTHWYDHVYLPVIEIIRKQEILNNFPNRTETDLYLWISRHRADLEKALGWKIDTRLIAEDLVYQFSPNISDRVSRITSRILDIVIPDPLETGPPVGHWRRKYIENTTRDCSCLFRNILVPLGRDASKWQALEQAILISKREGSQLRGLHVLSDPEQMIEDYLSELKAKFNDRCNQEQIKGELAIDEGVVSRKICERAHWADIIVSLLRHPPGDSLLHRLSSGFHTLIRRCPRPVLAVPSKITSFRNLLFAYSDHPKSREALFVAAYMVGKWNAKLTVLSIDDEGKGAELIQRPARTYLEQLGLSADYVLHSGEDHAEIIIDGANEIEADTILIGGYESGPIVEIMVGSRVDEILRKTSVPVLLCR